MSDSEKIKELEKKVLELEKEVKNATEINHLTTLLYECKTSNQEIERILREKMEGYIPKEKCNWYLVFEFIKDLKWVFVVIFISILVFIVVNK